MRKDRFLLSWLAVFSSLVGLFPLGAGCGDSGTGGAGGGGTPAACAGIDISSCSIALGPSDDDTSTLQEALIDAQSGDVVCLCPGTYALNNEVSASTPQLTVRGVGATREDVILDFAGQIGGDDGLVSTADGFTVESLWVKNAPGNGITATGAEDVTFRNLKVSWDAGSVAENGAYAVYPIGCTRVLIEDCEIVGAADAGVYVGQSEQVIVRRNDVHANVAGIEIENCTDSEVYDNKSYDNSAGILVFTLPKLEKKDSFRADIHDNEVYDNNRVNFGDPSTTVGALPPGFGVLILAADETHVHANDIRDNDTASIALVSYDTISILLPSGGAAEPETDRDPENTYIYDNSYDSNGTAPADPLNVIGVVPLEEVLWDGVEKEPGSGDLCLGTSNLPSFRNIHGLENIDDMTMHTTDTTPHECEKTPLEPIEF